MLRRRWILGAIGVTLALFLFLVPEWLETEWLFYPLPRIAAEIAQNLFWAFTTSTIFMLFENSVNGNGSLLERYRDIEASVAPLPNTTFSHEFLAPPSDEAQRQAYEQDVIFMGSQGWQGFKDLVLKWEERITFEDYEEVMKIYLNYLLLWREQISKNSLYFKPADISD